MLLNGKNQQWLTATQKIFDRIIFLLCLCVSLVQAWTCINKYWNEQLTFSKYSIPLAGTEELLRFSVGSTHENEKNGYLKPYDIGILKRLAGISIEDYLLKGVWSPSKFPNMTAEDMLEYLTEPNFRLDL